MIYTQNTCLECGQPFEKCICMHRAVNEKMKHILIKAHDPCSVDETVKKLCTDAIYNVRVFWLSDRKPLSAQAYIDSVSGKQERRNGKERWRS